MLNLHDNFLSGPNAGGTGFSQSAYGNAVVSAERLRVTDNNASAAAIGEHAQFRFDLNDAAQVRLSDSLIAARTVRA